MSDKELRFTGGDTFTGLMQLYHEVMMRNELRNGYGAYEVNWAGGKSGISFGGNQMDTSGNKEKASLFTKILREARDEKGMPFFSEKEIVEMLGTQNEKLIKGGQSLTALFGDKLTFVNAALSSPYGQQQINDEYAKEMNVRAQHVDAAVGILQNPAAKAFYKTVLGKVLLFDYHNQLDLALDGSFIANYIDGAFNNKQRISYNTNKEITASSDYYTMNDHQVFLDSTKHCFMRVKDCVRRLSNIKKVFADFPDLVSSVAKELSPPVSDEVPEIEFPEQFAFFRKSGKWEMSFDLKLPPLSVPSFEDLTPQEMLRRAQGGGLYEYHSKTDIQRDTFYYDGASKHLFYIEPKSGWSSLAPYPHSSGEWYTVKHILVRKHLDYYYPENLPHRPNLANYDMYVVRMKKEGVEKEDLLVSLESEISNPDILGLLLTLHTPIPSNLIENPETGGLQKAMSLEAQLEDFFAFVDEMIAEQSFLLKEQDIISLELPPIPEREGGIEIIIPLSEVNGVVPDYQPSIWDRLSSYFSVSTSYGEGL